MTDCKIDLV